MDYIIGRVVEEFQYLYKYYLVGRSKLHLFVEDKKPGRSYSTKTASLFTGLDCVMFSKTSNNFSTAFLPSCPSCKE